jgi:TPR repeat protein
MRGVLVGWRDPPPRLLGVGNVRACWLAGFTQKFAWPERGGLAMHNIGALYQQGQGVSQDHTKAME